MACGRLIDDIQGSFFCEITGPKERWDHRRLMKFGSSYAAETRAERAASGETVMGAILGSDCSDWI